MIRVDGHRTVVNLIIGLVAIGIGQQGIRALLYFIEIRHTIVVIIIITNVTLTILIRIKLISVRIDRTVVDLIVGLVTIRIGVEWIGTLLYFIEIRYTVVIIIEILVIPNAVAIGIH